MARARPALVRGQRARFWRYADDNLVLKHPLGLTETSVPVPHLADDARMQEHYLRLADKRWVTRAEIAELREIAAGTGT